MHVCGAVKVIETRDISVKTARDATKISPTDRLALRTVFSWYTGLSQWQKRIKRIPL